MPPERDTTRRLRGAVADGRLDKTFRAADVNLALNIGFAGTFLPKHCVGNPGNNTELFVKISEGFTGLSKTRKTSIAPHFSALAGDAKIQAEDRKATLVPTLLNSKDSLVIKLLIANFNGAISADARIEGVELKPISQLAESRLALAPIISAALRVAPAVVGIAGIELALKSTDLNNDYKRPK